MDGYLPFYPGMAGTPALPADLLRDLSASFALRTGGHPDELPERGTCGLPHLARTPATGAGFKIFRLASRPAAGSTGFCMHHLNFTIHAGNSIFQPYLDPHQEVCAGLWTGMALASPKEIKDIPETGEIGRESTAAEPTAPGIGSPGSVRIGIVAHVVILPFFLLVREDAVCLVDLFELLLGPGLLADIRMEFAGKVAVGFLDLRIVGIPGYAERFVVVLSGHDPVTRLLLCSLH